MNTLNSLKPTFTLLFIFSLILTVVIFISAEIVSKLSTHYFMEWHNYPFNPDNYKAYELTHKISKILYIVLLILILITIILFCITTYY